MLEELSVNPLMSLHELNGILGSRGFDFDHRTLLSEHERLMRLTWVPDIIHFALLGIVNGDNAAGHVARLNRLVALNGEDEKLRIETWQTFCIDRLFESWMEEPCSAQPSPLLGEENMQWTLSLEGMMHVFSARLQIEQPARGFPRARLLKRGRVVSNHEDPVDDMSPMKRDRPLDLKQQILMILIENPTADITEIMAELETTDWDSVEPIFESIMNQARIEAWLHEFLYALTNPSRFDQAVLEAVLTLHAFEQDDFSRNSEEDAIKGLLWIQSCIEPLKRSGNTTLPCYHDSALNQWVLSPDARPALFRTLL
jgi:hypothetical protein